MYTLYNSIRLDYMHQVVNDGYKVRRWRNERAPSRIDWTLPE